MTERQLRRTLARNIRTAREACGLTMTEAARRAGMSQAYWSMLEDGKRWPSRKMVVRMTKVLGLEPLGLFEKAK